MEGLRPNARGPGLVTFGPDRVRKFCETNDLQMIVRAHECVMDGRASHSSISPHEPGLTLLHLTSRTRPHTPPPYLTNPPAIRV